MRDISRTSPRTVGFSVIELLVTLGIVSVLTALALPLLFRSMESSKIAVSASNLRQIHLALHQQAQDNDGVFPYGSFYNANAASNLNYWWQNALLTFVYGNRYNSFSSNDSGEVLRGSILYTPLIEKTLTKDGKQPRSFGMNSYLEAVYPARRWALIPFPAETMLMGDCYSSGSLDTLQTNPRNRGKVQFLFADGHVELWLPDSIPTVTASSKFWVGRGN